MGEASVDVVDAEVAAEPMALSAAAAITEAEGRLVSVPYDEERDAKRDWYLYVSDHSGVSSSGMDHCLCKYSRGQGSGIARDSSTICGRSIGRKGRHGEGLIRTPLRSLHGHTIAVLFNAKFQRLPFFATHW